MEQQPWYKQFWPWFLIILPSCAVTASIYTFYLASNANFTLVAEDYYKQGKGINQDLSRLRAAKNLNLTMQLQQFPDYLLLSQQGGQAINAALWVRFSHATLATKDFQLQATADGNGNYRIPYQIDMAGKWQLQIESYNHSWRLQQSLTLPLHEPLWVN